MVMSLKQKILPPQRPPPFWGGGTDKMGVTDSEAVPDPYNLMSCLGRNVARDGYPYVFDPNDYPHCAPPCLDGVSGKGHSHRRKVTTKQSATHTTTAPSQPPIRLLYTGYSSGAVGHTQTYTTTQQTVHLNHTVQPPQSPPVGPLPGFSVKTKARPEPLTVSTTDEYDHLAQLREGLEGRGQVAVPVLVQPTALTTGTASPRSQRSVTFSEVEGGVLKGDTPIVTERVETTTTPEVRTTRTTTTTTTTTTKPTLQNLRPHEAAVVVTTETLREVEAEEEDAPVEAEAGPPSMQSNVADYLQSLELPVSAVRAKQFPSAPASVLSSVSSVPRRSVVTTSRIDATRGSIGFAPQPKVVQPVDTWSDGVGSIPTNDSVQKPELFAPLSATWSSNGKEF